MPVEVVMPRLGWGGEDGSLVEWIKKDGELVKAGDVICTVEGDKAVNDVESLDNGVLRILPDSPAPGVKVPVGTVLAYLVGAGEKAPFEMTALPDAPSVPPQSSPSVSASTFVHGFLSTVGATAGPEHEAAPPISPRARRVAAELGVDWVRLTGTGRTGRIVERDVRAVFAAGVETETARISPVARRVANELGVNLDELARQKPGARITREDVEEAARRARELAVSAIANSATSQGTPSAAVPIEEGAARIAAATAAPGSARSISPIREVPMGNVRRIIARRMAESARTVAPVTLTTEADATELVRLREQLKRDREGTALPVPSYNDLLARAAALALEQHPELNASLQGETIVYHATVDVGIAVDTERGLLVPVLRDVGGKSVQRIARESAPLIERARSGKASSNDLSGATFTITNLGPYEIDAFTPIVNLPECAILGIGRIVARPVVVDEATETIAVRKMLALSLTFDHRLVDGAPAARCLQTIKRLVERPTLLI